MNKVVAMKLEFNRPYYILETKPGYGIAIGVRVNNFYQPEDRLWRHSDEEPIKELTKIGKWDMDVSESQSEIIMNEINRINPNYLDEKFSYSTMIFGAVF